MWVVVVLYTSPHKTMVAYSAAPTVYRTGTIIQSGPKTTGHNNRTPVVTAGCDPIS
jgi:hypothetical protein